MPEYRDESVEKIRENIGEAERLIAEVAQWERHTAVASASGLARGEFQLRLAEARMHLAELLITGRQRL